MLQHLFLTYSGLCTIWAEFLRAVQQYLAVLTNQNFKTWTPRFTDLIHTREAGFGCKSKLLEQQVEGSFYSLHIEKGHSIPLLSVLTPHTGHQLMVNPRLTQTSVLFHPTAKLSWLLSVNFLWAVPHSTVPQPASSFLSLTYHPNSSSLQQTPTNSSFITPILLGHSWTC